MVCPWLLLSSGCCMLLVVTMVLLGVARDDVGGLHHRGGVRVGGACLEG